MKNKTTAAIMAFFLGGIGGQFFYLGKAGIGILCLVFCWTFIPCFIALYHTIKFMTMTDEAFNLEYNGGQSLSIVGGASAADELAKLHNLKEIGAINEQEYEARKARLLA